MNPITTITLGYYILGLYERLPKALQTETEGFDDKIKSNIMTTAAILEQRGEKRGEKRGMHFTKQIIQIELILKGLTGQPPLDIPTIQLITGQKEAEIQEIQAIFNQNDVEKMREFLYRKFQHFGVLTELEETEITNLLNNFSAKKNKKSSKK